jgi:hypothetical protein
MNARAPRNNLRMNFTMSIGIYLAFFKHQIIHMTIITVSSSSKSKKLIEDCLQSFIKIHIT